MTFPGHHSVTKLCVNTAEEKNECIMKPSLRLWRIKEGRQTFRADFFQDRDKYSNNFLLLNWDETGGRCSLLAVPRESPVLPSKGFSLP